MLFSIYYLWFYSSDSAMSFVRLYSESFAAQLFFYVTLYSACNTHPPGAVLATCSQSFCLLPKTRCELGAWSTGSTLLFLALLECCFSALLFCLLSLHFDHVRKLLFGLAALSQNNNPPPRPVTCCWTVMEKHSCDKVNNKLPAGQFYRKTFLCWT